MRPIKFRIWDGKKMFFPDATKEGTNHYLQFGTDGFWLFNSDGKMVTASEIGGVCMQNTGLKDNNGKDIYEGDVMTYTVGCGCEDGMIRKDKKKRHVFHALVSFHNGAFVGKQINGDGSLTYGFPLSILEREIIEGNAFERPTVCFLK